MTQLLRRYGLILAEAARLREKYQAARPEQFNLFSVLRRPGDEVLSHALQSAKVHLLRTLWGDFESVLNQSTGEGKLDAGLSDTSEGQIKKYLRHERGSLWQGLILQVR